MARRDSQRLPSGDIHPAFIRAELAVRGHTLTGLAQRHRKDPSYFRVALVAPFPKAMRILAHALESRPHLLWPSLFDEQDLPIKARTGRASTSKLPTKGKSRSFKAAA